MYISVLTDFTKDWTFARLTGYGALGVRTAFWPFFICLEFIAILTHCLIQGNKKKQKQKFILLDLYIHWNGLPIDLTKARCYIAENRFINWWLTVMRPRSRLYSAGSKRPVDDVSYPILKSRFNRSYTTVIFFLSNSFFQSRPLKNNGYQVIGDDQLPSDDLRQAV